MKKPSTGELTEKLKEALETARVPVIHLTSLIAQSDQGRAASSGAVYVSKMCRCSELVAQIRSLLSISV
jgi:DNA-binding response OmpR family regulator